MIADVSSANFVATRRKLEVQRNRYDGLIVEFEKKLMHSEDSLAVELRKIEALSKKVGADAAEGRKLEKEGAFLKEKVSVLETKLENTDKEFKKVK